VHKDFPEMRGSPVHAAPHGSPSLESPGLRRRSRPQGELADAARDMQREAGIAAGDEPPPPPPPPPPRPPASPRVVASPPVSPRTPTTPVGPVDYVDVPPDAVDAACQVVLQRPAVLLVAVVLPTALIFMGILSVMPAHFHRRHPVVSARAPPALVLAVLVCVSWLVADIHAPIQLLCRRVPVAARGKRRGPDDDAGARLLLAA